MSGPRDGASIIGDYRVELGLATCFYGRVSNTQIGNGGNLVNVLIAPRLTKGQIIGLSALQTNALSNGVIRATIYVVK